MKLALKFQRGAPLSSSCREPFAKLKFSSLDALGYESSVAANRTTFSQRPDPEMSILRGTILSFESGRLTEFMTAFTPVVVARFSRLVMNAGMFSLSINWPLMRSTSSFSSRSASRIDKREVSLSDSFLISAVIEAISDLYAFPLCARYAQAAADESTRSDKAVIVKIFD